MRYIVFLLSVVRFGLVREGKLVGCDCIGYMCVYLDFSG